MTSGDNIEGAVVFGDVVGFTAFTAAAGDTKALAVVEHLERLIIDELPPGARLVKNLGDGVMLWFPDAKAAVDTTVRLQQAFVAEGLGGDNPLWVRMGVHWGHQLTRGDDLIGHDVNVAARVMDQAGPGEVLISDVTRQRVAGQLDGTVAFWEIGPATVKGVPEPIWIHRVERVKNPATARVQ